MDETYDASDKTPGAGDGVEPPPPSSDHLEPPPASFDDDTVEPIVLPSVETVGNGAAVGIDGSPLPEAEEPTLPDRLKTLLIGKPRNLADQSIFKHVSLVAFLAWVGLGADGLSSSCYGPAEAFKHLQGHHYLAVFLALAIAATVFTSRPGSHNYQCFPAVGGCLVASKLLGRRRRGIGPRLAVDC